MKVTLMSAVILTIAAVSEAAAPPPPGTPVLSLSGEPIQTQARLDNKDEANLYMFLLPAAETPAPLVLVCPGGGYGGLAMDYEGYDVALWLNQHGVAAAVLAYRVAPHRHPAPLQDAQQAIRLLRGNSAAWNIDSGRIAILGFSAGGHLASTTGTHFADADARESISSRPDFMILVYPVISLEAPFGHLGSRDNLLGAGAEPALARSLSNHLHVTENTPPAFLMHTTGDSGVSSENSVAFYLALLRANVPAEMHLFEQGAHGCGLGQADAALRAWPDLCIQWLRTRGILPH